MQQHRSNVLRCYRELLYLIKKLPTDRRLAALEEARARTKVNIGETDLGQASEQLKELVAKISFLRISTPRQPGDRRSCLGGTFVLRGGELVPGEAVRASRVADGTISMEEARQRHQTLLRRQHFGRDPPKAPMLF
ncbi:hypothetical protein WJX72_006315 [[Myrmecia] bisecta]|uniref:Uncharacterized protein n=1 Tax=[Myrmecia] bisecta TaxID=41462 RepID=A0AAW1Q149_9CHLO